MAMRSQVYAWDLFGGTQSTGAPTSLIMKNVLGVGSGYSTGDQITTTSSTGSGTGMKIGIVSVSGAGKITEIRAVPDTAGSGYAIDEEVIVDGGGGDAALIVKAVDFNSGNSHFELGKPFSIFTGGKGNQLGRLPNTTATQFVVIDSYGCTPSINFPGTSNGAGSWISGSGVNSKVTGQKLANSIAGPRAYLQIYVNTTGYFKDPDGVPRDGVPGTSIPYPRTIHNSYCKKAKQTPIYILPGQVWDVRLTCYNDNFATTTQMQNSSKPSAFNFGELQAFIKYTLYDGADALIATKLMEMGIAVTPNAVDNYKQKTIEAQMAADARKALEE